jgi:hypothetical protein
VIIDEETISHNDIILENNEEIENQITQPINNFDENMCDSNSYSNKR